MPAEVSAHLTWHEERGTAARTGATWSITQAGRMWLAEQLGENNAPTTKVVRQRRDDGRYESATPTQRLKPEAGYVVRNRLIRSGLWEQCEAFAKERGVAADDLVGQRRTKYLARVRFEWYAFLMSEPGRSRSACEVARLCGRRDHSTVLHGVAVARASAA